MANRTRRRPSASRTSVNESRGEKRVAIVTRISTDEINQPYSLEAQTKGLEAFVSSQPGHVITHRFVDQASGATLDRPGLQAALSAAKTGEFDVLLVYRIDRLTRSIVGLMTIVEALDGAGVALRSATEPIDTQGPVGRMLLQLLGIFAEFERGLLIDRITKGFERKAARGEWLGGPGPFGYHVESASKTLVPDPIEAAMVRKIFVAYADEHLGATGLANHLNGAGLRNRGDRLWSNQTVLRVLRNPVYLGKISHGDDVYEGKHPSIVDDDLFARAQLLLDERAAVVENRAPNTSDYMLTGMLRCSACGGAYFGAGTKGRNGFYRYYACRNRLTKGTYGCRSKRVAAEDLEAAVIGDLIQTLSRSDLFEQAVASALVEAADTRPRLQAELVSAEAQLRETEGALNHYLRAFETGEMPAAICSPRVTELTQRRDELVGHLKELATQLQAATPHTPTPDALRAICAEIHRILEEGNPDAVKQLLRELIDRVEITPDRHAYPYFWVPSGCEAAPLHGEPVPDAPPAPTRKGDAGWLFVTSGGGGGIRTRVLRSFNRPSPSAAGTGLSGAASLPAVVPPRSQLGVPGGSLT
jgi:site-specific DNA recombinase